MPVSAGTRIILLEENNMKPGRQRATNKSCIIASSEEKIKSLFLKEMIMFTMLLMVCIMSKQSLASRCRSRCRICAYGKMFSKALAFLGRLTPAAEDLHVGLDV